MKRQRLIQILILFDTLMFLLFISLQVKPAPGGLIKFQFDHLEPDWVVYSMITNPHNQWRKLNGQQWVNSQPPENVYTIACPSCRKLLPAQARKFQGLLILGLPLEYKKQVRQRFYRTCVEEKQCRLNFRFTKDEK